MNKRVHLFVNHWYQTVHLIMLRTSPVVHWFEQKCIVPITPNQATFPCHRYFDIFKNNRNPFYWWNTCFKYNEYTLFTCIENCEQRTLLRETNSYHCKYPFPRNLTEKVSEATSPSTFLVYCGFAPNCTDTYKPVKCFYTCKRQWCIWWFWIMCKHFYFNATEISLLSTWYDIQQDEQYKFDN